MIVILWRKAVDGAVEPAVQAQLMWVGRGTEAGRRGRLPGGQYIV